MANSSKLTAHRSYTFDRYLNARTAHTPAFSPDGRYVAFVSDMTGVPQLWQVPVEGGWPDQLTFAPDRVTAGHYAHHRPEIVFGMDRGGNEREQLFLLRGGDQQDVIVDPAVMHYFGAFSPDDRKVAFSDNRRHPAYFDVYTCDLENGEERCVYQQDGSNFATDWSPDGTRLLVQRRTGSLDMELVLLDLQTGAATQLSPDIHPTVYQQAVFAPDGASIYLVTNQESEYARAARMDLDTRHIEFLTTDDADVDWLALSPDGRQLALVRNIDGYGQLTVRSTETGAETSVPALPQGVVMQPTWSNDSRMLAMSFTASAYNLNIWVWDLSQGECRQLTHAAAGGIPRETFVAPELIHFRSFDGLEIPAFLYMPSMADRERPPVVVVVHGGPEGQAQPIFNPVTQYLVNRGYAVLAPNVRGSIGYGRTYTHLDDVDKRMDSVSDLEAAHRWLRSLDRVDGARIAVMGGSYGGFMVLAALTTYPDIWAAGVDIVGIANFETFLRNTGAYRRHWRIPEYGDPDLHADLFRRISPIHHVDRIKAPLMVIHGDNDPRVPLGEAEQMVEALRDRGLPVEFMRFADEGHGIVKLENKLVAYPAVGEFLDRYVMSRQSSVFSLQSRATGRDEA